MISAGQVYSPALRLPGVTMVYTGGLSAQQDAENIGDLFIAKR